MNFPFFRQSIPDEASVLSDALLDGGAEILPEWQDATIVTNLHPKPTDPIRQAAYIRIGLVSVEQNAQLPPVLHDAQQSALVQHILLPRNPRIAGDELYQLDGMDYIVMLSDKDKRINKDMVRWLNRLKHLDIPMIVLLPFTAIKRRERQQLDLFTQRIGIPVVSVAGENVKEARQHLMMSTMQFMPAMSLALAAHLPSFRDPLVHTLLQDATQDSLLANDTYDVQINLVRQICAAYSFNAHQFEQQQATMETLIKATSHYTHKLVNRLPLRNEDRRSRFSNALSTLFVGYATAMHLGATAPSVRKDLIPRIWRLYRASRHTTVS